MNHVVISGNLTRDPEMRYTSGGKAITEFTVAVNKGYGEKRTTHYIRCVSWERIAEAVANQARRGSQVVVEGELQVDTWTDKQTGSKRERMLVNARSVLVSGKPEPMQERLLPQSDDDLVEIGDLPF